MTPVALAAAVAVGLVVGLGGGLLLPSRRAPRRLAAGVGVGAAVLGTLAATMITPAAPGFGVFDVAAPALFAAIGVTVLAVETSRRLPRRPRPPGTD